MDNKKDKLEKFVTDNRDRFDVHEPSPEVWDKVVKRGEEKPKSRKITLRTVLWRAAAVVVIFIASYFVHDIINRQPSEMIAEDEYQDQEILIPEVIEAEAYYSGLINEKLDEVRKFADIYPDLEDEVKYDLSVLDSIYFDLKKDLRDNIANEEIVEAMIQNYRMKLEILEELLDELTKSEENDKETLQYEI